jgi:hypothetical protein
LISPFVQSHSASTLCPAQPRYQTARPESASRVKSGKISFQVHNVGGGKPGAQDHNLPLQSLDVKAVHVPANGAGGVLVDQRAVFQPTAEPLLLLGVAGAASDVPDERVKLVQRQ